MGDACRTDAEVARTIDAACCPNGGDLPGTSIDAILDLYAGGIGGNDVSKLPLALISREQTGWQPLTWTLPVTTS